MSAEDSHWVESLFPATFTISSQLSKPNEEEESGRQKNVQPKNVFELAATQIEISPADLDRIENVYERVWLMNKLQENNHHRERGREVTCKKQDKCVGTDLTVQDDNKLWNSSEIGILRNVFQQCKKENYKLKAECKEHDERHAILHAKSMRLVTEIETLKDTLQEATKANERLAILSENLQKQLKRSEATESMLVDELKSSKHEIAAKNKEIHAINIQRDRDRIRSKKYQRQLLEHKQVASMESQHHADQVQIKHDLIIATMQKQITSLTESLQKEASDHRRTSGALEHLQKHFTNLNVTQKEPEELVKWTY